MSVTKKAVSIKKASDPRQNYMTLGLYCLECDRWGEITPNECLPSGRFYVNYTNHRFKCSVCGGYGTRMLCHSCGANCSNISKRENSAYLSLATGIGCAIILAMTVIF